MAMTELSRQQALQRRREKQNPTKQTPVAAAEKKAKKKPIFADEEGKADE